MKKKSDEVLLREEESIKLDNEFLLDNPHSKICEFYYSEGDKYFKCTNEWTNGNMARGSCLCTSHNSAIQRDNDRRQKMGVDIPNSFDFIKPPFKAEMDRWAGFMVECDKPEPKTPFIVDDIELPEIIIENE